MDITKTGSFFKVPNTTWEVQFTKWDYEGAGVDYGIECGYTADYEAASFNFRIDIWKFMFRIRIHKQIKSEAFVSRVPIAERINKSENE